MKLVQHFRSRIVCALLGHAQSVIPFHRRDWVQAMYAELEHVDKSRALQWAVGCVLACYIERLKIMNRSSFIVSRWLLAAEALVCFLPATALWIFSMFYMHSLLEQNFAIALMLLMIIAPVNLWFALRFVVSGTSLQYKINMSSALFLAMYAAMQVGSMQNQGSIASLAWFPVDARVSLLFFILPALCCWHLSFLARAPVNRGASAQTSSASVN